MGYQDMSKNGLKECTDISFLLSLSLIWIQLLLVLRPDLTLFNRALLHKIGQLSEVQSHVIQCKALIRLKLAELCLDKCGMHLFELPHGFLIFGGYELGARWVT